MTVLFLYRSCVKQCKQTGCVKKVCLPQCNSSASNDPQKPEPLYLRWKQWDCQSDCRYHCMLNREKLRAEYDLPPVKYHGKWPFTRVYGIQVCLYVLCFYIPSRKISQDIFAFGFMIVSINFLCFPGTCFSCSLSTELGNAFPRLAILCHPVVLQASLKTT